MPAFQQAAPLQALPPKVFISYSHEDRDFAQRLAKDLLSNRILVWWDDWMIRVGDSLLKKIEEGLSTSSYLGIILTPASVASSWVREELNAALLRQLEERRVFVLPILAQDCQIPLLLRDKKYADFRTSYDEGLSQLLP
jgi:predicted nucleotide-binding protein